MKQSYYYEGPVMYFDKCILSTWKGYTYAESERKAKSNLAFRYKQAYGLAPTANITLPGRIELVQ